MATYSIPTGAQVAVDEVLELMLVQSLQKLLDKPPKHRILPEACQRVEVVEARRPKEGNVGQMAKIDGIVAEARLKIKEKVASY